MAEQFSLTVAGSRKRLLKDKLAEYGIKMGGGVVLMTLLLIFFYLLYVVYPVFESAKIESKAQYSQSFAGKTYALAMEEQNEIAYRYSDLGINFFNTTDPDMALMQYALPQQATSFGESGPTSLAVVFGLNDGNAIVAAADFDITYPDDKRLITPQVEFPFGEQPIEVDSQGQALKHVAIEVEGEDAAIVAVTADNRGVLLRYVAEENFMTEELEWSSEAIELPSMPMDVEQVLLTPNFRFIFMRSGNKLSIYDIRDTDDISIVEVLDINEHQQNVTHVALLTGASSLLVGNDNGVVSQWFEVAKDGERKFTKIRQFDAKASVTDITIEYSRKGFMTVGADNSLSIFHTTGEATLLHQDLKMGSLQHVAISPRANAFLVESEQGIGFYKLSNEHPEVTWSALWQEVWYEGYPEPDYVWQSTSASDDFEAKLSLVPITFGTIKAAFYAMLFAVPIAVAGAIYTAYFMNSGLRKVIKPTVEIMEALPTVILGFLAGLWLAPFVEMHLPGVMMIAVLLPFSAVMVAAIWHFLPQSFVNRVPQGAHVIILLPVLLLVGYLSVLASPLVEDLVFDGDARAYINDIFGFDQRNSLIVGIAMGFAVIPTIFSIAEDAIFSVPKHLTQGSLALGATSWQTLVKVVLLTASPGIFSAVMMGLGRAVGETMIVLMATGNTPVMDFNIFSGMRTLAANIAVEMPESEVGSSHYRVLFLAAFVLFVLTFVFNTLAEYVRQRLREKYSAI
ncbi:ABC transporter permease subunit [Moritella marina ATCC 15381]|uniref:ABC transporter permease subunit n=1 Tax=Moritella marina ATCC 15381 TaxID=1202962 RepID=A0A5J6WH23_MORMI|nr:ABC transporter permease subunit [Moritella marina]QFI36411.1 ABC transporter permease subunit [Moritella marina ATCC 15381]